MDNFNVIPLNLCISFQKLLVNSTLSLLEIIVDGTPCNLITLSTKYLETIFDVNKQVRHPSGRILLICQQPPQ